MVAVSSFGFFQWAVQRRVSLFGVHLFWWTLVKFWTKAECENAFNGFTEPGNYGERL